MAVCRVPAALAGGFDLPVTISVGGLDGSADLFSYGGPEIISGTLRLSTLLLSTVDLDTTLPTASISFDAINVDQIPLVVTYGPEWDPTLYSCGSPSVDGFDRHVLTECCRPSHRC
eukprot:GABV01009439.1.p2 GENE.GABV01009439.1~~GABV01009439.1.p2  ORF type:complete len:116 (+),score=19.43 GABV01009439.1:100-447(+)